MENAKVLVVEDSPTQAQMVRLILQNAGYEVVLASDGAQGFEFFNTVKPDLVLLDVNLPTMSGFEVCQAIKTSDTERFTPVIILTTHGDVESKVKGLDLGADDYLPKPFDTAELLARARAMLRIKRLEDRILKVSITDELTGLYNRRFFMKRMIEELASAQRYSRNVGLVIFDIDHFKSVNDSFGHQFGDLVLSDVGRILEDTARKGDVPARYGGEEFVMIVREADTVLARSVAERLRTAVAEKMWRNEDKETRITVSSGVAAYPESVDDPTTDAILRAADKALYAAKGRGRNRTEVYDQGM